MAGTDEPSGVDQVFLSLERELAVFLRRARATSGELARAVHPELESAAYGLLVRLADAGRQRATDLAGYFGVGKATMSRQLRALEDLGLIAREPDPADGRAVLVRLTDEGHDRFSCVRNSRRAQYARQLASWDRREVAELARLLHRLNGEQDAEEGCGTPGKGERAGKGDGGGDGGNTGSAAND
ncbi:MarR family winged helix-turn-helix transcriptional regulator [Streptomyces rimosus]|uniref:MarR family winged helix-turn-helix transcriptional regulator n=1 Tax=Streptomyces rimosus TaxID=1927 RepID=UPI000D13F904|nr:MarR family transcriptional regulator [Streptomyces rimosus]